MDGVNLLERRVYYFLALLLAGLNLEFESKKVSLNSRFLILKLSYLPVPSIPFLDLHKNANPKG